MDGMSGCFHCGRCAQGQMPGCGPLQDPVTAQWELSRAAALTARREPKWTPGWLCLPLLGPSEA